MDEKLIQLKNQLNNRDENEVYAALIRIGKDSHKALKPEVETFLTNPDIELRSAAIMVLAFYWKLPEYRQIAWELFQNDKDDWVRSNALMSWIGYAAESKDAGILNTLYAILSDGQEDQAVRAQAYTGILLVAGVPQSSWPNVFVEDVDNDVDWELVRSLVKP